MTSPLSSTQGMPSDDSSIISSILSYPSTIEPLNEVNYDSWREKLKIALAVSKLDVALIKPCPTKPQYPIPMTDESFELGKGQFLSLMHMYENELAKWDHSNKLILMIIKSSITKAIREAIPECDTTTQYLDEIGKQFASTTKSFSVVDSVNHTNRNHKGKNKVSWTHSSQQNVKIDKIRCYFCKQEGLRRLPQLVS